MMSSVCMSKLLVLLCVVLALVVGNTLSSSDESDSSDASLVHIRDVYQLQDSCESVINEQISWELYASHVYLNMAGYFNRPTVSKLGFGKFFSEQSREEYDHAVKFIDYINSRNGTVRRIAVDESPKSEWSSPREALLDAIKLEKQVFKQIQHIHNVADQKCQDEHLQDFLESYFYTEQVESIKELQTMLTTLQSGADAGAISVIEHLEDKRLAA